MILIDLIYIVSFLCFASCKVEIFDETIEFDSKPPLNFIYTSTLDSPKYMLALKHFPMSAISGDTSHEVRTSVSRIADNQYHV
jgi:hypothetical protein